MEHEAIHDFDDRMEEHDDLPQRKRVIKLRLEDDNFYRHLEEY